MDQLENLISKISLISPIREIKNDKWNNWSSDLLKIPYSSAVKGVGPGEFRIADLFNTKPLGQNISYDINLPTNYKCCNCEIKETDNANSFRTGRDGRDKLRPIKSRIITLLNIFRILVYTFETHLSASQIKDILSIIDISPDEICKSNIIIINNLCHSLHELKIEKNNGLESITIFDSLTGKMNSVSSLVAYNVFVAENRSQDIIKEKIGDLESIRVAILTLLNHEYIIYPRKFMEDLNGIRVIFDNSTLILVNKKGYYILTTNIEEKISFDRITLGVPRFKVHPEIL